MVSLVDIVPQKRSVQIAAGELELRGLGLRQIADLFVQFLTLRNLFTEGTPDVSIAELIVQAPDAIATIIGTAADQPEAIGNIADGALTPDEIIDCLEVIHALTFPRGVGPLFERMKALAAGAGLGLADPGKAQDTNAPSSPSSLSPPDMIAAE
jgi:hypothetical protein